MESTRERRSTGRTLSLAFLFALVQLVGEVVTFAGTTGRQLQATMTILSGSATSVQTRMLVSVSLVAARLRELAEQVGQDHGPGPRISG